MFDAQGFRKAALQAGIPQAQVEQAIAQRTGVRGWLTGGKTGIASVASGVGNVLNLPSYAIGGALNQLQRGVGSKYGQQTDATGLGLIEGIKSKRGVFTEAPETLGIDPSSGKGKAIGFVAELLTPNIPIGKALSVGKLGKVANIGKNVSKIGSKAGGISQDIARTFLEKSYKLNRTNIDKIAEAIGATDEATKAVKVIDYLEGLGLKGANRKSLDILNKKISSVQKPFDALVKTNNQISRTPYIKNILDEAIRQESLNTPASIALSERLFKEGLRQEKLGNKALTDTGLSKTISQLWSDVAESGISDPKAQSLAKSLAKSGSKAREFLKPGSEKMGRKLRGMITAQEQLGKQANTGLGTQLFNTLKPSATGFGLGVATGYASGQNPLTYGLIGGVGNIALNNPRVLNTIGKRLSNGVKLPKIPSNAVTRTTGQALLKTPLTAFRVSQQPTSSQRLPHIKQVQKEQVKPVSYIKSIPQPVNKTLSIKKIEYKAPQNVFRNKSSFGKVRKLKSGSFN